MKNFYRYLQINNAKLFTVVCLPKEYVEFYVGKSGDFDTMVASSIKQCQKRFGTAIIV